MTALEERLTTVGDIVIRIEERLGGVATKSLMWGVFAGTLGVALLTLLGHLLIRTLGGG